jgi:hypothetical protein
MRTDTTTDRVITIIKVCTENGGERDPDKIAAANLIWRRVTIGDRMLPAYGTWFRQLYVSSSNCIRRPRFGADTRAILHEIVIRSGGMGGRRRRRRRRRWRRQRGGGRAR